MLFLGIEINSLDMTLRIDNDRLKEIHFELEIWLNKNTASLKEVQSLLGKLNFAAGCIRQGRLFLSRIIEFLKSFKNRSEKKIPSFEMIRDISWWRQFMDEFNGVSLIPELLWFSPDAILSTDACLSGGGGYFKGKYFHFEFPASITESLSGINQLELFVILVAIRTWKFEFGNINFNIFCDNETSVRNLNSGKSKIPITQSILREIRFHTSQAQFQIKAKHLPGKENRIADCLSRWHLDTSFQQEFYNLTSSDFLTPYEITDFAIKEFW
jgi:hypothetical protein